MTKYIKDIRIWIVIAILLTVLIDLSINGKFMTAVGVYALIESYRRRQLNTNVLVVFSVLFFALHYGHTFFNEDTKTANFEVEKKLTFLLFPFLFANLPSFKMERAKRTFSIAFPIAMSVFALVLLFKATQSYLLHQDVNTFFYHEFSGHFGLNAIYLSLVLLFSFCFINDEFWKRQTWWKALIILFHLLLLFLLSSKIILILSVLTLLWNLPKYWMKGLLLFILLLPSVWLSQKQVPTFERFKELFGSEQVYFDKTEITDTSPFTGLSLRLTIWNIGKEMWLADAKSFVLGVGVGDTQNELNDYYKKNNFYTGNGTAEDIGYLNYNFHNQFVQSAVDTGFIGLLLLLTWLFTLLFYAIACKSRLWLQIGLITVLVFCTESYLSRQLGIVTFLAIHSLMFCFYYKEHALKWNAKRIFDWTFALFIVITVLLWLLPVLFLFAWLDTRSCPLFIQKRAGWNAIPFNCFKIKTMRRNKETGEQTISIWGNAIRRFGVDELPQFFNVLLGNMSVVGPRPLMLEEEAAHHYQIPDFSSRLVAVPGITGLSQCLGHKGSIFHPSDLQIRYRLDKKYKREQSFGLDLWIMGKTIFYFLNKLKPKRVSKS